MDKKQIKGSSLLLIPLVKYPLPPVLITRVMISHMSVMLQKHMVEHHVYQVTAKYAWEGSPYERIAHMQLLLFLSQCIHDVKDTQGQTKEVR